MGLPATLSRVTVILETQRLVLREIDANDLDFLAQVLSDSEVMHYWPRSFTRDETREWIDKQQRRYREDGCGYWLAVEKDTSQPIGQVGVMMVDLDGARRPGLGYIIHQPFWRRGYATEAARGCCDFVFNTLDLPGAIALVRPENTPSIGVAEKLGMSVERRIMFAGFEHLVYAVRRSDHDG